MLWGPKGGASASPYLGAASQRGATEHLGGGFRVGKVEESLLSECLMPSWSSTRPVFQMCDAVGGARDEDAEPIGQDEEGLFIGKLGGEGVCTLRWLLRPDQSPRTPRGPLRLIRGL